MSLDKFKSIIQDKGRFVPENELEIFQQYDLKTSFGSFKHDTIRVIIYDASNNPLPQRNYGLVRYINKANQPQYYKKIENVDKKSRRNYTIDVKKLIKDAGYNIGIFTVEMMFVNNRLGTQDKPNRVWIQEISPSRTEIRVLPFDVDEIRVDGLPLQQIIDERYQAFLNDEQFKEDIFEAIDPFLDSITLDNIRELLINQVTEPVFNEIIKQYFKNNIFEFNKIINNLINAFKNAVRFELQDKDSLIGRTYNTFNPNFGKDKPTSQVSIDFPTFCFNKLLESLEVYIPKLVDFEETEFVEDIEEFTSPTIRPTISVPTQRDPNPPTPTPTPTPTLPPGVTPSPTPLPRVNFDREQGRVKVSLYSNQPKNLLYKYDAALAVPGKIPIVFDGFSLEPLQVKEYDYVNQSYVSKDLNFIQRKFNTTDDTEWDGYVEYLKQEKQQLIREFTWTDSERDFASISPIQPIIPNQPTIVNTNIKYIPNDNYLIPYYYFNENKGDEKNIEIFKDNRIEIELLNWPLYYTIKNKSISINDQPNSFTDIDGGKRINCSKSVLLYGSKISSESTLQGFFPQAQTEDWVFEGFYNWDTGELLSDKFKLEIKITKDINIFLKFRRITIPTMGVWKSQAKVPYSSLNYVTGKFENRYYDVTREFYVYEFGKPSPIQFGGTGNLKYINWGRNYPFFKGFTDGDGFFYKSDWQELVKITDPTKGGVYQQPTQAITDFLKDKKTFSKFEL
jgi:hypothetical protein